jgi:DNA-binding NarL/FixJ family response regulator
MKQNKNKGKMSYQSERISILLVDDHRLIRDTWSQILNTEPQFIVVGSTGDGEEAINLAKTKRPRIVLMDINMSPIDGFETTKSIRTKSPNSRVIGVSMHAIPVYAKKMMQIGSMGYVTKNSSRGELIKAILEVDEGRKYICEEVKNILVEQQMDETNQPLDINSLSKREIEIVKLIKDGLTSKDIAPQLNISLKTVEVHRYNILKKLNVKNTAALVNLINANGI